MMSIKVLEVSQLTVSDNHIYDDDGDDDDESLMTLMMMMMTLTMQVLEVSQSTVTDNGLRFISQGPGGEHRSS